MLQQQIRVCFFIQRRQKVYLNRFFFVQQYFFLRKFGECNGTIKFSLPDFVLKEMPIFVFVEHLATRILFDIKQIPERIKLGKIQ